jgi:hypothetical protein
MRKVEIENGKAAIAVAAALLDVVIAAPDNAEFEVCDILPTVKYEAHILVRSWVDGEADKWIRIDGETGNILEREL